MPEHTVNRHLRGWSAVVVILLFSLLPGVVLAAGPIYLDGQFSDWSGQPYITDPAGDGASNSDLRAFYWATNPGQEIVYFMFQRTASLNATYFAVLIDTNNDGDFSDSDDRLVIVRYTPRWFTGYVQIWVFDGDSNNISTNQGNWGDSMWGFGRRAEIGVSFADLGIDAHQTINMAAVAFPSFNSSYFDWAPDSGTITWAPIPTLGWVWLTGVIVVVVAIAWYTKGRFKWQPTSPS